TLLIMVRLPRSSPLFPYTTLFRSRLLAGDQAPLDQVLQVLVEGHHSVLLAGLDRRVHLRDLVLADQVADGRGADHDLPGRGAARSEEHTSELQSRENLVCRLLLEK